MAGGEGTFRDAGVSIYRGTMKMGKKDGFGSLIYKSGMKYKGSFKEDKWNGLGSLTVPYPPPKSSPVFVLCLTPIPYAVQRGRP